MVALKPIILMVEGHQPWSFVVVISLLRTNSPSDGKERSDANCILIVVRDPIINYEVTETTQTAATIISTSPILWVKTLVKCLSNLIINFMK